MDHRGENEKIKASKENFRREFTFYEGSTVAQDGDLDVEITHRVIISGRKYWKIGLWVQCDRRINLMVNRKVYKEVVRLATMYWAMTRALKKAHEQFNLAQMSTLRWMCVVSKLESIGDEELDGQKLGEIIKKVQGRRLKWPEIKLTGFIVELISRPEL